MMKVIVTCGGTGGHITPALAIADSIRENDRKAEILFVGSERGMENSMVPAAGYPIRPLRVQGLSRSLTPHNLRVLWQAMLAVEHAKRLIGEFKPDIVIGTGGYACYPTLRAACALGVPTAVHESNAVPGLAVKRLAKRVDRVWLNFAAAADALPPMAKMLVVGNPLRYTGSDSNPTPTPRKQNRCKTVLSFGGSLGAGEINKAVLSLMEAERQRGGIVHLHATGKGSFEEVWRSFCVKGLDKDPHFSLVPFITDMPHQMAKADLVISRAGAMSISELAAMGKPAVLIPSPNVTGDHQYKNAKTLLDADAACLLTEDDLRAGHLPETVFSLLDDSARRRAFSKAIAAFAVPDANKRILEDIRILVQKYGK